MIQTLSKRAEIEQVKFLVRTNHFFIAVELHHKSEQNRIFFLNVQKFTVS